MRSAALLLASLLAAACAAAEPEFTLTPHALALAGKVDFVLGDGHHPFVDDDNRRALLALKLHAHGHLAVLGFSSAVIERAVADSGETLPATLPQDAGTLEDHVRHDDPAPVLLQVGLPGGKASYRGLSELSGSVDLVYAVADPRTWEVPLAKLADETAIDGRDELIIAEVDDGDQQRLAIRLSPEARLAVVDLEFRDAAGKAIAIKPPRSDRRDAKAGKRRRQPVGGKDEVLVYSAKLPEGATVAVRYYPTIERLRVPIALTDVAFGVAVPDVTSTRAATQRGADDL
jgi:hypothetical protein